MAGFRLTEEVAAEMARGRSLTESQLFEAYRGRDGRYYADCACGGTIIAASNEPNAVAEAIDAHHLELQHVDWRREQVAVQAVKRAPNHRCPCCGGDFPE